MGNFLENIFGHKAEGEERPEMGEAPGLQELPEKGPGEQKPEININVVEGALDSVENEEQEDKEREEEIERIKHPLN